MPKPTGLSAHVLFKWASSHGWSTSRRERQASPPPSERRASFCSLVDYSAGIIGQFVRLQAFARLTRQVHRAGGDDRLWATASINGDRYCFSPSRPKNLRTEFAVRFRKVERPSVFREA
jgi:hypothetical protein